MLSGVIVLTGAIVWSPSWLEQRVGIGMGMGTPINDGADAVADDAETNEDKARFRCAST